MRRLRIEQIAKSDTRFQVQASLEIADVISHRVALEFDFEVPSQDQEDLRWYLEDQLQHPAALTAAITTRVEQRIKDVGSRLFRTVFEDGLATRELWKAARERLSETRIEIETGVGDDFRLPWELIREADSDPWVLQAESFVRALSRPKRHTAKTIQIELPIRILLVICRPAGNRDVSFRSVANQVVRLLEEYPATAFHVRVLRPPTFAQLGKELRTAQQAGRPYHIVHFDGHGLFEDLQARHTGTAPLNPRGFICFENPDFRGNEELIHGGILGSVLQEHGVTVLILNACRSANTHAMIRPADLAASSERPRSRVGAFGSLAHEVLNAGVPGVVAMSYNVYVATATQFVSDLYRSILSGHSLCSAVSLARKRLRDSPLRQVGADQRVLQDWIVPMDALGKR
jgi:hypothetical protein